jgi:hypothetical protein
MPIIKSRGDYQEIPGSFYKPVERLADRDGVSLSLKVRDLVKKALEIEEDIGLSKLGESREKSFNRKKSLKHDEVW